MAFADSAEAVEALAAEIGENIYMDIAKWHLYLGDAKLHTVLADRFYPMLGQGIPSEDDVLKVLQDIPIKLGGGRQTVSLAEMLPMQCQVNLMDLLEEYQRKL